MVATMLLLSAYAEINTAKQKNKNFNKYIQLFMIDIQNGHHKDHSETTIDDINAILESFYRSWGGGGGGQGNPQNKSSLTFIFNFLKIKLPPHETTVLQFILSRNTNAIDLMLGIP